nr:serine hydrolase domain-containing protein [Pseudoxanthomonas sp.]
MKGMWSLLLCLCTAAAPVAAQTADAVPDPAVEALMREARVTGLALAAIHDGQVTELRTYGLRDVEQDLPLTPDSTMYAASLTKGAFAYAVMGLVQDGKLDLDRPIADYLPRPLPEYEKYADLAGDERWRKLTARMLLAHTAGFPNFRFFTPHGYDEHAKLAFEFEPGSRFAYSGEGINLLQFVIEHGLGTDVGALMQERVFDRFGMKSSGMTWRDAFATNLALGYDEAGKPLGHKQRGAVRAAGSMDTTLRDFAAFLAGLARGEGLDAAARGQLFGEQVRIDSVQQFPTLSTETTPDNQAIGLAYGLGWSVYRTPEGRAFFKGGHDDGTRNIAVCVRDGRDCLLLMSNSSNADGIFAYLIDHKLGPVCFPWYWQAYLPYDHPELRARDANTRSHPPCTRWPLPATVIAR